MELLVIGNGFDIAHGLPTKYNDFTCFLRCLTRRNNWESGQWFKKSNTEFGGSYPQVINLIKLAYYEQPGNLSPVAAKLAEVLGNAINTQNIWVKILSMYDLSKQSERWVDCEEMIYVVISSLENSPSVLDPVTISLTALIGKCEHIRITRNPDTLFKQLDELKTLFDLYLQLMFENQKNISNTLNFFEEKKFDYVLSFNYTDTYERIYKINEKDTESKKAGESYIHGRIRNDPDSSVNIVLGIHDSLEEPLCNTKLEYAQFKKYFQRIICKTGAEYQNWFQKIDEENGRRGGCTNNHELKNTTIFGHSLDVTDKDILKDIILQSSRTTIYYYEPKEHKSEVLNSYILNLIQILGKEILIQLTNSDKLIFKPTSALS